MRRLASLSAVLAVAAVAACSSTDTGSGSGNNNPTVASVTITNYASSIPVNSTSQFAAVVKDAAGNTIPTSNGVALTWTSTAPATATVSSNGLVTGKANGSAGIIAAAGGKADTVTISVGVIVLP